MTKIHSKISIYCPLFTFALMLCFSIGCYTQPNQTQRIKNDSKSRPIDARNADFASRIRANWVSNADLQKLDPNLQTHICFTILEDGSIKSVFYEKKSGDKLLDESAMRTVKKSAPFPKLPEGIAFYDIMVIFTPKGLK